MTLAILLLGLVIATSFIAYWADNLGKKLGKKRISLLGIRPKQTATLISMISSVAIMLLTVGVLMAVVPNLRNALLRYDSAKQAAIELGRQNTDLLQNITGLRNQRQTLNTQLTSLQHAATQATAQRKAAVTQLSKVRTNLGNLRTQLRHTAQSEKLAMQGEKSARVKAQSAEQRYARVATQLKDAQQKVNSSRQLLAQSLNQLQTTHASLSKTNKDFDAARKQLATANLQLKQTQKSLGEVQQNFARVDQQVKTMLDQYRDAVHNVELLKQRRDNLETELKVQQQQLAGAEFVATQIATGNVEVAYGTVFAQTLIPSRTSLDTAKAQLQALIEAGQKAVQGKYTLILSPIPVPQDGGQDTILDAAQIIDLCASQLSSSDVAVSARLIAARDHAKGEQQILTRFILVPIHTVFTQGETVAESDINAQAGDALIFHQLLLLVNQGETKAHAKGSMPIATNDNPFFYAAGNNERVFEALRKIQTFSGLTKVTMIAAANITTVDPMQVQFVITGTAQNTSPSS